MFFKTIEKGNRLFACPKKYWLIFRFFFKGSENPSEISLYSDFVTEIKQESKLSIFLSSSNTP